MTARRFVIRDPVVRYLLGFERRAGWAGVGGLLGMTIGAMLSHEQASGLLLTLQIMIGAMLCVAVGIGYVSPAHRRLGLTHKDWIAAP
jgi:hypothetical protein